MRFHLFPFRTEKLSSLTPMVLRLSRGRVGSRLFKVDPILGRPFFVFVRFGWCAPQSGRLPLWAGVSIDCPDLFSGTGRSIADALLVLRKTLRAATGCGGSPDLWLEFAFGQKPAESTRDSAGLRGAKASARQSVDCHCRKNSSAVGQAGATHFVILSASEESICCRDTEKASKYQRREEPQNDSLQADRP